MTEQAEDRSDDNTIAQIREGRIEEGQNCDFKARLDFGSDKVKRDLASDVSAFLNSGPARLFIGVREGKNNAFEDFEPYTSGEDALCRQVTSIIQDSIEPKPTGIIVRPIPVEGGFILEVTIPEHRMRPYQHKAAGAFRVRTGRQNTPLSRDQVGALFTSRDKYEADAASLMAREDQALTLITPAPPEDAATLHIAIVPGEHYDRGRAPFTGRRGNIGLATFLHYHGGYRDPFKGTEGGLQSVQNDVEGRLICRMFVSDDWLLHSFVAHPFRSDHDRLALPEFEENFASHMANIARFLEEEEVRGPFAVLCRVDGLQRNRRIAWAFPSAKSRSMTRAQWVERVDDREIVSRLYQMICGASVYG